MLREYVAAKYSQSAAECSAGSTARMLAQTDKRPSPERREERIPVVSLESKPRKLSRF
jgi:hypothetical protein